jgi:hypothetical protein
VEIVDIYGLWSPLFKLLPLLILSLYKQKLAPLTWDLSRNVIFCVQGKRQSTHRPWGLIATGAPRNHLHKTKFQQISSPAFPICFSLVFPTLLVMVLVAVNGQSITETCRRMDIYQVSATQRAQKRLTLSRSVSLSLACAPVLQSITCYAAFVPDKTVCFSLKKKNIYYIITPCDDIAVKSSIRSLSLN